MLYALSEDERYLENIEFMEERAGTAEKAVIRKNNFVLDK